jgi:hypothetical protein
LANDAAAQQVEAHIDQIASIANNAREKLRPANGAPFSANAARFLTFGDRAEYLKAVVGRVRGSNPIAPEDFLSRFAGSTQSEPSVAWCGNNAVVGFNDSASYVQTLLLPSPSPSLSFSFIGYSVSTNSGVSFTDKGLLVADPLPPGVVFRDLLGDPVLGCTTAQNFYYMSIALDTLAAAPYYLGGVAVLKSGNGGQTFGPAIMAVGKDAFEHELDKPWMAVARGAMSESIHISYTDFDFSFSSARCGATLRTAIEYVRSTDGGVTWSNPFVLAETCGFTASLQDSHVEAGLGQDVYVAWESYPSGYSGRRAILIRKSANGGATFGTPVSVTDVVGVGDGFGLQGGFRNALDLQGLAVDRSTGSGRGDVYIAFQDGRNLNQVDYFAFPGCATLTPGPHYCFADVFLARSSDGGATWRSPVRVNDDPITARTDQFMPALAVDRGGNVYVLYYDRSRDPRNVLMDVVLGRSTNGGTSWVNNRLTVSNFPVIIGQDSYLVSPIYMGDYIGLAADALQSKGGVIAAWGDNSLGDPNVRTSQR